MQGQAFATASRARSAPRGRLVLSWLVVLAALSGTALAQSFLGTVRGTVVDPQGAPVQGAAVMVVDESTGVPRTAETDAEGRYEVSNLRPGTYRVEVVTTSFKKAEQTGIVLRASGIARSDIKLEIGALNETVTVSAETADITLESQAVASGLDQQQIHDLPRGSRDIQDFLLLNPNVVGGTDDIQFLGGRTYGVTYVQDGQASTNAIFGTIGNSAPGIDAISEMTVLSNSYSAEYGGLAGVVVTTKRGANQYHGTSFYDFNSDSLNALAYNQKLAGTERGDPNSDTHQHRWGASVGGPLKSGKTFFYANYEGSNDKAIFGGGRATVPSAAMRNGDFSGASFVINDPLTGQPFPGNVIPAERIDPAARRITDFFYPLPNQDPLSTGFGVFQEFVPGTRNRQRADLRLDHELTGQDSVFIRGSYQERDPSTITFEGGNALTNLGIQNRTIKTATAIAGWTRIFSPSVVNEFRAGYNFDKAFRQSNYNVHEVDALLGLENPPSIGPERVGFSRFEFTGGSSSSRPTNITDGGFNADRTIKQNSFSVSDNLTWIMGGHSLKAGALFTRNSAIDGRGRGVQGRGRYRFNGTQTGNAYADMLLGLTRDVTDFVSTRDDLDGHSNDFALFVQDDWKASRDLTLFMGLRYEIVGSWHEKGDVLGNFRPDDGGYHIVPSDQIATLLPPGLQALGRIRTAAEVGVSENLVNTDKNNFSPRVGFAYRLGGSDRTVVRGGFGLFHPTVAVQGVRDLLASNMFRYGNTRRLAPLQHGFTGGTEFIDAADFGNQGIDPNLESPDIYQYNLTVERAISDAFGVRLSYIGSTMRKLLVDRDANTIQANTEFFDGDLSNPESKARLPLPLYGFYADDVTNAGSGQFHSMQVELTRRFRGGLAFNVAYTLAHSDSNVPDVGDSSLGGVQFDPYDIEKDRGPDPNVVKHRVVANATWELPVGKGRSHGANMPGWANALFGGWTVSSLFQARSGNHLTPFFSSFYTTSPWNTGKPLDGLGNAFCCAWRPDQVGDPNSGGSRDAFFNQAAYALPAPGQLGNAKKGSLLGPGTWVVNFALYKDIVQRPRFKVQLTALLDNAFNHPQFFVGYGSEFAQLDSFLIDGDPNNGTTAVLGEGAIRNVEGFAPGRQIRFGLRATF
jgi:hypothetical protein